MTTQKYGSWKPSELLISKTSSCKMKALWSIKLKNDTLFMVSPDKQLAKHIWIPSDNASLMRNKGSSIWDKKKTQTYTPNKNPWTKPPKKKTRPPRVKFLCFIFLNMIFMVSQVHNLLRIS